jgi:RNA polymerase sigma factor (sigma-70 family)
MTDQELITILKKNDLKGGAQALKVLYKKNYYMVEDYIVRNSGTKEDAKDLFQDSMIVLYKNLQKENFVLNGKISSYLYSISRNIWLKKLRDTKILTTTVDDYKESFVNDSNIVIDIEYSENQRMLANMLIQSGEKCKKILKAFYYEKMSMKKIASTLGYSNEQIVRTQKLRCLKKIRLILNKNEHYYENLENSY